MKITRIDVYKFNIPLIHEVVVPIGKISAANNIAIRISTDEGLAGWGEASPFAPITGDSQVSAFHSAALFARIIMNKDPTAVEARMAEIMASTAGEPSLRSAFDMALYDIQGQAAGLPLYRLLGGEKRVLCTDFTIGLQETVALTLERLQEGLARGYKEVKVKVGRRGLADVEHIAAVRAHAGPDMQIRIDANQAGITPRRWQTCKPWSLTPFSTQNNHWPPGTLLICAACGTKSSRRFAPMNHYSMTGMP